MTIYRFKIFNNIGNILNIGVMTGERKDVESFCQSQIQEARKNSNCKYQYEVVEMPPKRKTRLNSNN